MGSLKGCIIVSMGFLIRVLKEEFYLGSSLVFLGSLFIRVPYYVWDLKRDPSFENYPCRCFGCGGLQSALRGSKDSSCVKAFGLWGLGF